MSSSEIYSYPSTGGYIRKRITQAELKWLNPSTWREIANGNNASNDVDEEDAFALRLMQLGGRWWPNQKFYKRHSTANLPRGDHYPPDLDIGQNSTGSITVLRTRAGNAFRFGDLPNVAPVKPGTWSRLSLCDTMEERYQVLENFGAGAVTYNSIEECPDLPNSLEEGIAEGKHYAELLNKLEDSDYMDQWLDSL